MRRIFHITTDEQWQESRRPGKYMPKDFGDGGFIHCSYAAQVLRVVNSLFRGQSDLVLLEIEPSQVGCEVIDEALAGCQELFPHIYGPLPVSAVVAVHVFPCADDGSFNLPDGVSTGHERKQNQEMDGAPLIRKQPAELSPGSTPRNRQVER